MTLRQMLELIDGDTPIYVIFDDGKDVSSSDAQNLGLLLDSGYLDLKIEQVGCSDNQIKIWTE